MPESYDFDLTNQNYTNGIWDEFTDLCEKWKEQYDKTKLVYIDGGNFLKIFDNRGSSLNTGILENHEKELFLFCNFIRTKKEIEKHFFYLSLPFIEKTLNFFLEIGIVYEEDGVYLNLALPGKNKSKERLIKDMLTVSLG